MSEDVREDGLLFNDKGLAAEEILIFRSSFNDFASKHGRDERFKAVEKSKDRESMFKDYVDELRKKEKEEKAIMREKVSNLMR